MSNWKKELADDFVYMGETDYKLLQTFVGNKLAKQRKEILEEIRRMKLWSKGTVEGTRNDIIAKLKKEVK